MAYRSLTAENGKSKLGSDIPTRVGESTLDTNMHRLGMYRFINQVGA